MQDWQPAQLLLYAAPVLAPVLASAEVLLASAEVPTEVLALVQPLPMQAVARAVVQAVARAVVPAVVRALVQAAEQDLVHAVKAFQDVFLELVRITQRFKMVKSLWNRYSHTYVA
jgi:hypothetical protein